jgi:hypothetical protein
MGIVFFSKLATEFLITVWMNFHLKGFGLDRRAANMNSFSIRLASCALHHMALGKLVMEFWVFEQVSDCKFLNKVSAPSRY